MLKIIETKKELLEWRKDKSKIGFVPTMGNLHKGHLSLVERSLKENRHTLVSIFVNPTQFNDAKDYEKYPRTIESDTELLSQVSDEIVIFAPKSKEEVFPSGFRTQITVNELSSRLCGKYRPGHFSGVCNVVYLLLNMTGAQKAYFGKKDFQQLLIIEQMVRDLNLAVEIIACPLIRDKNGLALSSRNNRLNEEQKQKALLLKEKIGLVSKSLDNPKPIIQNVLSNSEWEYLEVLDAETLSEVEAKTKSILIAGAMFVDDVRLIDNKVVEL